MLTTKIRDSKGRGRGARMARRRSVSRRMVNRRTGSSLRASRFKLNRLRLNLGTNILNLARVLLGKEMCMITSQAFLRGLRIAFRSPTRGLHLATGIVKARWAPAADIDRAVRSMVGADTGPAETDTALMVTAPPTSTVTLGSSRRKDPSRR